MFARVVCRVSANLSRGRQLHQIANSGCRPLLKFAQPPVGMGRLGQAVVRQLQENRSATPDLSSVRVVWNKLFGKYLLATNVVSSGLLMVLGDLVAQEIEYRRHKNASERFDLKRVYRMFIVGAMMGPMHHYIYKWMDRVMPVASAKNAMWKILIDQTVMSPACILLFFYSACYLEHKSVVETNQEVKEKFAFIYLMDWIVWPGAQYVNFRYLDTKYRVVFVNVCTALYNIFLSYMKHDFDIEFLKNV